MASREQMSSSIAPGSLPYGERGPLEANLPSGASSGAATPPAAPAPAAPSVGFNFDPLDALSNGIVPPQGQGQRLAMRQPVAPTTRQQRLRAIAQEANNPALRHIARSLLLRDGRRSR